MQEKLTRTAEAHSRPAPRAALPQHRGVAQGTGAGLKSWTVWKPLVPYRHEFMEKSWRRSACRHQVFFGLRANTPGGHVVVHLKKVAAAFGRRRLFEVADYVHFRRVRTKSKKHYVPAGHSVSMTFP